MEAQVQRAFEQSLLVQWKLMAYFVSPVHDRVSLTIHPSISILASSLKITGKSKRGMSMYKNMFSDFAVSACDT